MPNLTRDLTGDVFFGDAFIGELFFGDALMGDVMCPVARASLNQRRFSFSGREDTGVVWA